ncbi:hypothetical protein [uncultured Gimesia sp.]|jgi:hypothetical protein|uniref:hypothetical protein n=1 Tax=uncultured Gimesia sp. TaxID=1678688 RepID=UPI00260E2324|nr:hypothetical protein [uncultured Gimesia sp.]
MSLGVVISEAAHICLLCLQGKRQTEETGDHSLHASISHDLERDDEKQSDMKS